MKIMLLVMLVGVTSCIGFCYGAKLSERPRALQSVINGLKQLRLRIFLQQENIVQAMGHIHAGYPMDQLAEAFCQNVREHHTRPLNQAMKTVGCSCMLPEDEAILGRLELGTLTLDAQIQEIDRCISLLEEQLKAAAEGGKNAKMFTIGGVLIGLFAVVILL